MNGRVLSVGGNGHGSVGSVGVAENEPLDTHDRHSPPAPRDARAACHAGRTTRNAPRTKMHTVRYAYDIAPMATHATHTRRTVRRTRHIRAAPRTRCHTLTCTTSRTDTPTHTYHTCSVSHATQHTTRLAQLAVTAHYTMRHKPGKPCRRESSGPLAGLTAVFTAADDGQEVTGAGTLRHLPRHC